MLYSSRVARQSRHVQQLDINTTDSPLNEGPGRKAAAIAAATSSRSSARTAASDIAVDAASDPGSAAPDVGAGGGSLSAISMSKIGYRKRNA